MDNKFDKMELFKLIHSELIMEMQYIEQDLRIVYATLMPGDYNTNLVKIQNAPLGKILKELKSMDKEIGYSKFKDKDLELLNEIKDIRNYWCHQCYLDFHYIENPEKKMEAFNTLFERQHYDENRIYELQQRIERLRKNVIRKHKHDK